MFNTQKAQRREQESGLWGPWPPFKLTINENCFFYTRLRCLPELAHKQCSLLLKMLVSAKLDVSSSSHESFKLLQMVAQFCDIYCEIPAAMKKAFVRVCKQDIPYLSAKSFAHKTNPTVKLWSELSTGTRAPIHNDLLSLSLYILEHGNERPSIPHLF